MTFQKGFPLDAKMDNLINFFTPYDVESIYMRRLRTGKNTFKGSVFVLFPSVEKAEEFLSLDAVKYCATGMDLIRESRKVYAERKANAYQEILKYVI